MVTLKFSVKPLQSLHCVVFPTYLLHHRFDEVQVARDRRKNGILVKIGLPLLRLSTDGSSEKERIVGALEQAMQRG